MVFNFSEPAAKKSKKIDVDADLKENDEMN